MFIKRLVFLTALLAVPAGPAMAGDRDGHGWRGERHSVHRTARPGYRAVSYEGRRNGYRRGNRHHGRRYAPPRRHRVNHKRRPYYRHPHHYRGSRVIVRESVVIHAAPAYVDPGPACDSGAAGTVLGGLTGAAIGSGIGKGEGRTAAILTGAVLGAVIGNGIGHDMDRSDANCNGSLGAGPALIRTQAQVVPPMPAIPPILVETAPLGDGPQETTAQQAPVLGGQPETNGRYCREYQSTATINGQPQPVYGTACRKPDGTWEIVS